jgi:2'-5' RNA ligase
MATTHTTAVVIIPPPVVWEPIQAVRQRYDRQVRRWMPHITVLYPFRPAAEFPELLPLIERLCAELPAFTVCLRDVCHFRHGRDHWTLWLDPLPNQPLEELVERLLAVVPDCGDTARFPGGYRPHLSVGQATGTPAFQALEQHLRESWAPLTFEVDRVSLIRRGEPPDDVFRVAHECRLGPVGSAPDLGTTRV